MPEDPITQLSSAIQVAIAPVFLLSALGTILSVLTMRLGRVVDRARVLAARASEAETMSTGGSLPPAAEIMILRRRRALVNYAITSAVVAALLVCLVIALAFLSFMMHSNFAQLMAWLFVLAMAAFIATLLFFLREIVLTVASLHIGHR
ncbi:MAG TPA: DUF2721 domain-containing protein [Polyangiales bacterium]|nr:DUF2721 domain-containing protein [Polyangiales bacterium]